MDWLENPTEQRPLEYLHAYGRKTPKHTWNRKSGVDRIHLALGMDMQPFK